MFGEFFGLTSYYNTVFMLLLLITRDNLQRFVVFALLLNTMNLEVSNYISSHGLDWYYEFNIFCELLWATLACIYLKNKSRIVVVIFCLLVAASHHLEGVGYMTNTQWTFFNRVVFEVFVGVILTNTKFFNKINERFEVYIFELTLKLQHFRNKGK